LSFSAANAPTTDQRPAPDVELEAAAHGLNEASTEDGPELWESPDIDGGADGANEVQTQSGQCVTHGTVEAQREVPSPSFPFILYAVRRALAARQPYRCPNCGAPVTGRTESTKRRIRRPPLRAHRTTVGPLPDVRRPLDRVLNDASRDGPSDGVISVRSLQKSYGSLEAVKGIDLEVARGEIFAFLGPNGAGKTTTVEILEGFRTRTAGEVSVLGVDPAHAGGAWRDRVGAVLQESQPEPGLTVRECLQLYAGYYAKPRDIEETIALVGLDGKADTLGERLSGGQRRRLDVALALIGDPELIFLDEPTTGFDPSARRTAWSVIEGLRALGKTVFLTTHYMDEAEQLADRIAIIAAGEIVAQGTPETLGGRENMAARIRFTLPDGTSADALPAELCEHAMRGGEDGRVAVETMQPLQDVKVLADWALARGIDLPDLDVRRPSLEDVYLELTEREQNGARA
jgi:ABC-2 type transport system ATP-binding protein